MQRLIWLGILGLVACDDGTASAPIDAPAVDAMVDAAADAPVDASTVARAQATVSYAGTAHGALVLAAFSSMPPMGPPMGFAQQATPTWPATLAIDNLAAGRVYLLALLDVAPASPSQPGPEDRLVWSAALTLTLGQTTTVALTLTDPSSAR